MPDFKKHRVKKNDKVNLSKTETDGKNIEKDRDACKKMFESQRRELISLQSQLYAEGKQKLLVLFQAVDAGGKDGTIRSVFEGVNPQGVVVTSFKPPSDEDLAHDFLWRIHKAVPPSGMIGVFNRSHYEDVLVVRVHKIVPESVWSPRYEFINDFEKMLTASGTRIVKFFLHISKNEQKQRFQERIDKPDKRWKFDPADLEKRKYWDDYEKAFEDMLEKCSTDDCPWYIVPADQNWYRDWVVTSVIVQTLKEMNPQYPAPPDVSGVVVE
ncbi:MAG TPA: polyphosphate kinase 2 family protein [Planctomycetaceae bacterium]|nr:polyphosphate kinase 2 family protein [Planctomycetaceae bacterium]